MVAFLRTLTAASSALPAALALAAVSSASPSPSPSRAPGLFSFPTLLFPAAAKLQSLGCARHLVTPKSALGMDSPATELKPFGQKDETLPELQTEFMVDMKCDGCVYAVKNNLQSLDGVKRVDVDLNNQVVRVLGSLPVKTMLDALEQTGRKARLIGQGSPEDFQISAAVAEFKGPIIFGVVRLAQVSMELARIEASFSGLEPGKHGWAINEFGDLTKGAASTGKVFNPANQVTSEPLGDLGTLEANENGEAHFSGPKEMLRVADLIGRSIVLYGTEDKSDTGIAAAVIARSAGVGENYKKLCTCDGVTIWESS
uniref:Superoxide dismutase copper chaperone n=1 Tax=Anthurium amnicola TaxID=1678845 RepID=A0A1D1XRE1_9ARAE